jgi:hypothetical protein
LIKGASVGEYESDRWKIDSHPLEKFGFPRCENGNAGDALTTSRVVIDGDQPVRDLWSHS